MDLLHTTVTENTTRRRPARGSPPRVSPHASDLHGASTELFVPGEPQAAAKMHVPDADDDRQFDQGEKIVSQLRHAYLGGRAVCLLVGGSGEMVGGRYIRNPTRMSLWHGVVGMSMLCPADTASTPDPLEIEVTQAERTRRKSDAGRERRMYRSLGPTDPIILAGCSPIDIEPSLSSPLRTQCVWSQPHSSRLCHIFSIIDPLDTYPMFPIEDDNASTLSLLSSFLGQPGCVPMLFMFCQLELAYINTSHPDFIGGSRAIAEVMERNRMPNGGSGGPDVRHTESNSW